MKIAQIVVLSSLSLAVGCGMVRDFGADTEPELVVKPGASQRTFDFTYAATVPAAPEGAKRLDLWLPLPQSTASQSVKIVSIDAPVEHSIATEPESGNRMVHLAFEGEALKGGVVTVKSRVRSVERKDDDQHSAFADPPVARHLEADALAPWSGQPAEMAQAAAGDAKDPVVAGERMYRSVLEHMRYSKDGQGWGRGDIRHACTEKFGNCTDFHALFIAMARSRAMPARFIMGFPLPEQRGEGEVKGYHCWAEFWVDGVGWVPVDASEADKHPELADYYFGSLTPDRVAFTMGRDLNLEPRQQGPRLNYFVYPYAELDGKPFDGVQRSFRYADVAP